MTKTTLAGVSSLGKVAYVITLAPYFVLTALLIYAAQREVSPFLSPCNGYFYIPGSC